VYLSEYDVWTGVLGPYTSTIAPYSNGGVNFDHTGEDSGAHVSFDNSCAPLLNKSLQQFLPYLLDTDAPNNNLLRAREGHFEVIEMGEVLDPSAAWIRHDSSGVPASCAAVENAWKSNGQWDLNPNTDMAPATGGLFGAASIIDVNQGFNVSYDAVALENFWPDAAPPNHTPPGSIFPNLADGSTNSVVFNDGVALSSAWLSGVQAVSAVFMRDEVYNEYNFETSVEGMSQWVITFPTKFFHVNTVPAIPPFTNSWNGDEACEEFSINIWDREEQFDTTDSGISPPPPGGSNPSFCYETNTLEFRAPGAPVGSANVLGTDSGILTSVEGVNGGTENGWARVNFKNPVNQMIPVIGTPYRGLPVSGFMVQRFTNNNAQPGMLAQYGGLFNHKGRVNSAIQP
jgi:hypothetical protein